MSVNLTLLIVMGALYACGIYLILEAASPACCWG